MLPLWSRVDQGAMAMKGVLRIPQSSSITGALPSDCFVSYPGHSLGGESYSSAEMQSVYSTVPSQSTGPLIFEGWSYASAEMQLVYSAALAYLRTNWVTHFLRDNLIFQQRKQSEYLKSCRQRLFWLILNSQSSTLYKVYNFYTKNISPFTRVQLWHSRIWQHRL